MNSIVFTVKVNRVSLLRSDFPQTVISIMLSCSKSHSVCIVLHFRVMHRSSRQEAISQVDRSHNVLPYSHEPLCERQKGSTSLFSL